MELIQTRKQVLQMLDEHLIPYMYYEHERAHTSDACLEMHFINEQVTICKNILLCNRQQTKFYLLLLKPLTPFRTSIVSKALGASRLSFAPQNLLEDKLHLTSGSVSPLGLMFEDAKEITLCCETGVRDTPFIAFHPCDNAATVVFEQQVFWNQVIPALGVQPVFLALSEND